MNGEKFSNDIIETSLEEFYEKKDNESVNRLYLNIARRIVEDGAVIVLGYNVDDTQGYGFNLYDDMGDKVYFAFTSPMPENIVPKYLEKYNPELLIPYPIKELFEYVTHMEKYDVDGVLINPWTYPFSLLQEDIKQILELAALVEQSDGEIHQQINKTIQRYFRMKG